MDTKKYIIDLPDNTTWLQWVKVADKDGNVYFDSKNPEDLTPYIEPDLDAVRNKAYKEAYDKGYQDVVMKIGSDEQAIAEKAYQRGLDDAWEAARQVSNMTLKTQKTIFDVDGTRYVVGKYTAQEAMERIKNYENEKPEEYKFTPGDEIVYKTDHSIRVCVTSVNVGSWDGFALADVEDVCTFGGSYIDRPFEDWEKTGRKVEILKKAKEE